MAKKKVAAPTQRKYKARIGDVVAIKLRPGKFVFAKIAFISREYKGMVLFRVYDTMLPKAVEFGSLPTTYKCQFRAYTDIIDSGRWTVVGYDPSTSGDVEATRYRTSNTISEGDRIVRYILPGEPVSDLPLMVISPYSFVERDLRKEFGV